jgi:hypothetical protein
MKVACLQLKIILILLISGIAFPVFSQVQDTCDLCFAEHLVNTGAFREALFVLDSTACPSDSSAGKANYLRGWSYYSLKQLDLSSEFLLKVPVSSVYYAKSHYFAAYNSMHLGETDRALDILSVIGYQDLNLAALNNFEKAGANLLRGDTVSFRQYLDKSDPSNYTISESVDNIAKIAHDLTRHKVKSPWAAGIFSAVLPGSGKFYAGAKGGAISAFIATTGLALVTIENNRKYGTRSFPTIFFGTAFAFTYMSNIYGSVQAARLTENEYRKNVRNSILYNLHIPLRNTFDK